MGFGDALIGTGIAKKARQKHPGRPICIGDGTQVEWNEVHEGNPFLSKDVVPGCVWVHCHKGYRPYVDNAKSTKDRFVWKRDFKVSPGELYLTPEEEAKWVDISDFVYIEPNIKGWLGPNKDWGFDNWQGVVDSLPDVRFIQGPGRRLNNVEQFETVSFRDACALLARARLFSGTDGGLHHAAAALGKRAVVVWGGFTHPRNLGYDDHINLHSGVEPCGNTKPCDHCTKAMSQISVKRVANAIRKELGSLGTHPDTGSA